ncbi:MAG TPA: dockerin type I repeat-containing protein [Patescibacteria group bacterium]|nr:dockerin type I repeat-containing protein [Patescibacteria group bacterium]
MKKLLAVFLAISLILILKGSVEAQAIKADANHDGKVDSADYSLWLSNFNKSNLTAGDFNSDAKIDGIDYTIWLAEYGMVAPTSPPSPTAAPIGTYIRPFNPNSIWNKPINESNQSIAANSSQMIALLASESDNQTTAPFVVSGTGESWSVPVYFADSNTPRKNVCGLQDNGSLIKCTFGLMPVDNNFYASWDGGGAGADHKIAIIDTTNNHGWSAWSFKTANLTYQGQHVDYTANYAAYGWTDLSQVGDGITMHDGGAWGGRANGLSYFGGLIWPEEIAAGQINHALALSISGSAVSKNTYWWPSRSGDGYSSNPNALPYGARLQLDPTFDITTLPTGPARIVAKALQDYGAWLVDTGGSVGFYAREFMGSEGTSLDTTAWKNVGVSSSYFLRNLIPWSKFRILTQASSSNFYLNP